MRQALRSQRSHADYLERALDSFHEYLHARGLRVSEVRDAVVRCALQQPGSFRVEDLVRELQSRGMQDAHKGTVYRAMPLLVEVGLVRLKRAVRADAQEYEVAFERKQQPHLQCSKCGRITLFRSRELEALQLNVARRLGFEPDLDSIQLHGRCRACTPAKRKARA